MCVFPAAASHLACVTNDKIKPRSLRSSHRLNGSIFFSMVLASLFRCALDDEQEVGGWEIGGHWSQPSSHKMRGCSRTNHGVEREREMRGPLTDGKLMCELQWSDYVV